MALRLVDAGFCLDGTSVFPILNLHYDDDTYSKGLAQGIRNFVESFQEADVSADDSERVANGRLSEASAGQVHLQYQSDTCSGRLKPAAHQLK